jgi:hypothetical protein
MAEFILLMHADTVSEEQDTDWEKYISMLNASGKFRGGSSLGGGMACRKVGVAEVGSGRLTGYIRIDADDIDEARSFLLGNPTYEAGGTVDVRELVES